MEFNMESVSALILNSDEKYWYITEDRRVILDADPNNLIFVETYEDGFAKLKERYPTPHEALHKIEALHQNRVNVSEHYIYLGNDLEEAANLAKEYGPIYVRRHYYHAYALALTTCKPDSALRKCVYDTTNSHLLRFAPEEAEKEYKRISRNNAPRPARPAQYQPITINKLNNIIYRLQTTLRGDGIRVDTTCNSLLTAVHTLIRTIRVFTRLYGNNAHRRVESFKLFCAEWRKTTDKQRTKFLELLKKRYRYSDGNVEKFNTFFKWMDKEAKVRSVKTQTVFKVKRRTPSLDDLISIN